MIRKFSLSYLITIIILLKFLLLILCVSNSEEQIIKNKKLFQQQKIMFNDNEDRVQINEINENLLTPKNSYNNNKNRPTNNPNNNKDTLTYIRASIPMRIYQCIRQFTILRCMKLFILQRLETQKNYDGDLKKDFIKQFLDTENQQFPSLIDNNRYKNLNDTELTNLLTYKFQKFFKNRSILLYSIPDVLVQIIPSTENKIKLSLKKDYILIDEITGRRKKGGSYKNKMIQMAVPVLMMPAILMGTFLPFMIPAFKMATIMTTFLNNSALIAALLYAARTAAQQNDAEMINYSHPGYH